MKNTSQIFLSMFRLTYVKVKYTVYKKETSLFVIHGNYYRWETISFPPQTDGNWVSRVTNTGKLSVKYLALIPEYLNLKLFIHTWST